METEFQKRELVFRIATPAPAMPSRCWPRATNSERIVSSWPRGTPCAVAGVQTGEQARMGECDMRERRTKRPGCRLRTSELRLLMYDNLITTDGGFSHVKSGTVLFTDLIQQLP